MFRYLLITLLAASPAIIAEELKIPISEQGNEEVKRPHKSMLKADVERVFGAPLDRTEPVGEPPISRWHYEKFIVYFEYDHVVHTVLIHKRKPETVVEEQP
ncbi:hypothetical protein [Permianibacter aggregans]|uniref:SmpA/OmlA family protein n=1 Tax=Permianibacter aggregans TaxID=1510150 RepID=A0A4R6UWM5_9GAMM|nr:hypothetical protein [Permianibacter aggregans]QGX38614.1 hypothetical protein E2H98_02640 [Permianibacter aggregans]TDQ50399.1 hypothetical protein EV696_10280 [Permianibacter aggregans]